MDFETATALTRAIMRPDNPSGTGAAGSRSATYRVCEDLRRRIVHFELPPDTVLPRSELAEHYAVSLTPLREALQKLEAQKLVNIYPQSRTTVTRLVVSEILSAHFLRIAVEVEVVRRLADVPDPAVVKTLNTIVTMQETLADHEDEKQSFQELDELFHQTMMAGVGQSNLHSTLRGQMGHLARLRRLDLPGPGKVAQILGAHREIIASIEAGDPKKAQNAMREHLSQTVGRIESLRAEYPDYFA